MANRLPAAFRTELLGATLETIDTGMSGAVVYRVRAHNAPPRFLKIARGSVAETLRQEIARTTWLHAQGAPVPQVLRSHDSGRTVALLMSALPGISAEDSELPVMPLVEAVGRALAALHALPVSACPFDESVEVRLGRARAAVAAGEIDTEAFEPANRHIPPATLLGRLMTEIPEEDLVVAHGDATLANIMLADDFSVGFVDCGHSGRADRYLDLAITAGDISQCFGHRFVRPFARAYGLERLDDRKAVFFRDLYEFF